MRPFPCDRDEQIHDPRLLLPGDNITSLAAVPSQRDGGARDLGYSEYFVTAEGADPSFHPFGNVHTKNALIPLSGAASVDDYNIPGETVAEKIAFLRAPAARCRRLSNATGDYELNEMLSALADEYEAKIDELVGRAPP